MKNTIIILTIASLIFLTNATAPVGNYQYLWQYVPNTSTVTGREYPYHNFNLYITAFNEKPYPDQDDSHIVYKGADNTYTFYTASGSSPRKMQASDPASWKRFFYPNIDASLGPDGYTSPRAYVLYDLTFNCECWKPKNTKSCIPMQGCGTNPKFQLKVVGKMRVFTCNRTASNFYYNSFTDVKQGGSGNGKKFKYEIAENGGEANLTSTSYDSNASSKVIGVFIENVFNPSLAAHVPVCTNPCT